MLAQLNSAEFKAVIAEHNLTELKSFDASRRRSDHERQCRCGHENQPTRRCLHNEGVYEVALKLPICQLSCRDPSADTDLLEAVSFDTMPGRARRAADHRFTARWPEFWPARRPHRLFRYPGPRQRDSLVALADVAAGIAALAGARPDLSGTPALVQIFFVHFACRPSASLRAGSRHRAGHQQQATAEISRRHQRR